MAGARGRGKGPADLRAAVIGPGSHRKGFGFYFMIDLSLLLAQRNIHGFSHGNIPINSIFKMKIYILDTFENVSLNVG